MLSFKPYYNWNTFNTKMMKGLLLGLGSFKPYYNWNTFNTEDVKTLQELETCFKPYYNWNTFNTLEKNQSLLILSLGFKPYYNWNTFNTTVKCKLDGEYIRVLNLIITGIPSILFTTKIMKLSTILF